MQFSLTNLLQYTPFSKEEYYKSFTDEPEDEIERARLFLILIRCCQAIGAKTSDRTGWRSNINPSNHHKTKEWDKLPNKILDVATRLKEAQIENQPAEKLIQRYKRNDVLIYAAPPYILETRTKRHYKHEMTIEDHIQLLEVLDEHPGPVILSGYAHPIYDDRLKDWQRETMDVVAEAGAKKQEVL